MKLIQQILDKIPQEVFTDTELAFLFSGKNASRYNQVKRALAHGELIKLRRGLYCLAKRYQHDRLNAYTLAQHIHGPSYISFESALSYHQLIPEAVYSIASACLNRSREFQTPFGRFVYSPIPARVFFESVERMKQENSLFLMATPLKALADYVYAKHLDWEGIKPLVHSLRIEPELLVFPPEEVHDLVLAYNSPRVSRFLISLQKELSL